MKPIADDHVQLDWLIIGGGIHGVHIAARLIGHTLTTAEQLRIVDPGPRLLDRWRTLTSTTGMRHLRSPAVHHLDLEPWSLRRFAKKRSRRKFGAFAPPYNRPALELFNSHCEHVIDSYGLGHLHIEAVGISVSPNPESVDVQLSNGLRVSAKNVVLAIGVSDQPTYPDWAPEGEPRIHHVFDPAFDGWPASKETVALVGGGISSAQIAARLVSDGHRVHMVSRHDFREHQFDSDPGWLGPKFMTKFGRIKDYDQRRALITEARHRGSVPPDVYRALRRAIHANQLAWHEAEVQTLDVQSNGLVMGLNSGESLEVQRVLLATGFASSRPGGALVDEMIRCGSLPVAKCGYPIVDTDLRWHPRVYVSGALAELELGPVARNIAGARRAGDRLVESVLATQEFNTQRRRLLG